MRPILALAFAWKEKSERLEFVLGLATGASLRRRSAFSCTNFSLSSFDSWALLQKIHAFEVVSERIIDREQDVVDTQFRNRAIQGRLVENAAGCDEDVCTHVVEDALLHAPLFRRFGNLRLAGKKPIPHRKSGVDALECKGN